MENYCGNDYTLMPESWLESKTKTKKNSLGATWNASHLSERLCALCHWKRVSMPPTTQSLRHRLTRAFHIGPKDKNRSPFHGEKPLMIKWFLKEVVSNLPILHGRNAILRVRVKWLIFNMVSQLWADVKYHVPTGFGFSPKAVNALETCRRHILRYNRTYFRGNKSFLSSI